MLSEFLLHAYMFIVFFTVLHYSFFWHHKHVFINFYIFLYSAGVKAYLHDRTNPGWLPSLDLGQPATFRKRTPSPVNASDRYNRVSQRKEKRKVSEVVSSLICLKKRRIVFSESVHTEDGVSETTTEESESLPSLSCDKTVSECLNLRPS